MSDTVMQKEVAQRTYTQESNVLPLLAPSPRNPLLMLDTRAGRRCLLYLLPDVGQGSFGGQGILPGHRSGSLWEIHASCRPVIRRIIPNWVLLCLPHLCLSKH